MGKPENMISKQITDYLDLLKTTGIVVKYWRNQVLKGLFRPNKKIKEYWINQGIPGLSDYSVILCDGMTLYLEAKTKKGKHLETQKQFQAECKSVGTPYVKAKSADEVSDYLAGYFHLTKWEKNMIYLK